MAEPNALTDGEDRNVKAFDEGMEAWQNGKSKSDCSYEEDTRKHEDWIDGYEVIVLFNDSSELP